jgi:hypothetical protein
MLVSLSKLILYHPVGWRASESADGKEEYRGDRSKLEPRHQHSLPWRAERTPIIDISKPSKRLTRRTRCLGGQCIGGSGIIRLRAVENVGEFGSDL